MSIFKMTALCFLFEHAPKPTTLTMSKPTC